MASCGDSGDVTVNTTDGGSLGSSSGEASGSGKKPVTIDFNSVEMMKTEKSFSSGTKVQFGVLGSDPALKQKVRIVLVSGDPSTAVKVFNGAKNLTTPVVWNGNEYTADQTINVVGVKATLKTEGERLNSDPKQYVAITETIIDRKAGFFSAGTPVSSLPEGIFTYSGHAWAKEYQTSFAGDVVGTGTFTLEANFTNKTASMSTTITTDNQFEFKADNMVIDSSTGTFSTDSARIGKSDGGLDDAAIRGAFAGSNAEGVHGTADSNGGESPKYSGAFYGKR